VKKVLIALTLGYFFWVYNPATNGLYPEGGFMFLGDCATVRQWTVASQPAVSGLMVSPACYQEVKG
jgi:hypothetical protein